MKGNITISVPNDITKEELKTMRQEFNQSEISKDIIRYIIEYMGEDTDEKLSKLNTLSNVTSETNSITILLNG